MSTPSRHVLRIFVSGALAALPLFATLGLLFLVVFWIFKWLGPESLLGRYLASFGLGVAGREWVGYAIGFLIVAGFIFLLGILVERGLQKWISGALNALLDRIPVVGSLYSTLESFVGLVSRRDQSQLRTMRPVWCHFGGPGGVSALALLSSPDAVEVGGQPCYAVIVPTAPVPIGGGLLFVPVAWVSPAQLGMDALTSLYLSMGVTASQHLPPVRDERPEAGHSASAAESA